MAVATEERTATSAKTRVNGEQVVRFDIHQRLQHIFMFTSFIVLAATGLPLKFSDLGLSQWWISFWGGVETTRTIHHYAGWAMGLDVAYHVAYVIVSMIVRKTGFPWQMVPSIKDVRDIMQDLRYLTGLSKTRAQFDRFSYREKFDYFAVGWGICMMVGGGAILMYPVLAAEYLPNWAIPVALVAHSDEAILAVGWIVIVHLFFAHLAPNVFPFNKSIFTGKVPVKSYIEEHPLEYARMIAPSVPVAEPPEPGNAEDTSATP